MNTFSRTICGNGEALRTEAEISIVRADECCEPIAVVYEDAAGWHVAPVAGIEIGQIEGVETAIDSAKEALSHYVNHRGDNPPEGIKGIALGRWLMLKDDNTVFGEPA